jgi:hypothetical protein
MIEYLSMLTCTDKYTAIFSVGQIITNAAISNPQQNWGMGFAPGKGATLCWWSLILSSDSPGSGNRNLKK